MSDSRVKIEKHQGCNLIADYIDTCAYFLGEDDDRTPMLRKQLSEEMSELFAEVLVTCSREGILTITRRMSWGRPQEELIAATEERLGRLPRPALSRARQSLVPIGRHQRSPRPER